MNTMDARKLKHEELTELRKRGVTAVQNAESPEDVVRILGISRVTIYNWLALYRSGGWDALGANKRGGRKPKLDAKSMKWLYKAITNKTPEQYRFPFVLWTSKLVGKLIKEHFGIKLGKASICRLLNQLGLSAQRPLWRAYQQFHVRQGLGVFIDCMKRMIESTDRKVFLIVDGTPHIRRRRSANSWKALRTAWSCFFFRHIRRN